MSHNHGIAVLHVCLVCGDVHLIESDDPTAHTWLGPRGEFVGLACEPQRSTMRFNASGGVDPISEPMTFHRSWDHAAGGPVVRVERGVLSSFEPMKDATRAIRRFPLQSKPVAQTTARETLLEALRMIDENEIAEPSGCLVFYIDEKEAPAGEPTKFSIGYLASGRTFSTIAGIVGWLEYAKGRFLASIVSVSEEW